MLEQSLLILECQIQRKVEFEMMLVNLTTEVARGRNWWIPVFRWPHRRWVVVRAVRHRRLRTLTFRLGLLVVEAARSLLPVTALASSLCLLVFVQGRSWEFVVGEGLEELGGQFPSSMG
ncbi:unnamed protein product [Prorocentrum cordatum]|uniref:Uncharacterized protein n=1 Tax=Prorocentrum cordatum TaxID=2364126 RepID=A0ABN9SQT2_9DINO|nr:unnamed protein product [Polarella glacialis]